MTRKLLFILFLSINLSLISHSQNSNQTDSRSANRRFADSVYNALNNKKPVIVNDTTNTKHSIKVQSQFKSQDQEEEENAVFVENKLAPCPTLYNNTWCTNKVKMPHFRFGEFPDELILRLVDKKKSQGFHFPCNGQKSSSYGWRWNRPHGGIDFAINIGEPIYAVFDGVVRVAQVNGGYGKMILIRHFNNIETLYGHLDKINVKVGQVVKAGDIIGLSGNTGFSTGPHLHFETRFLYQTLDPEWILNIAYKGLKSEIIKVDKAYFGIERAEKQRNKKLSITPLARVDKTFSNQPYIPFKDKYANKQTNLLAQGGDQPIEKKNVEINNEDKSTWRYIIVKQGDTISKIALKFNITPKQIIDMNSLTCDELKIDSKIRIR